MKSLGFNHLRRVNAARAIEGWKHPPNAWSFDDWLVAVGGEVGEALNVVKKLNRERDGLIGNSKPNQDLVSDLADELADAVIYLDLLLASEKMPPIGSARTFDDMRAGAALDVDARGPRDASRVGRRLLRELCAFADRNPATDLHRANLRVLWAIDELAYCYSIDLGAAVIRKFNATSEKHGMPHRLVPA